jgi:Esterase PHB depolymerase
MNDMRSPNKMVEATRLTRAGRLTEATALLQRMLRAEPPDMTIGAGDIVPSGLGPPGIGVTAKSEDTDRPPSSHVGISRPFAVSSATTAQPHMFRKLTALLRVGRLGSALGLHGLVQPAPVCTPDIVPEGGKFIEATYSNPAGTRAYKLYIPSGYHGQALPLVVMLHGCTQSPDDFAGLACGAANDLPSAFTAMRQGDLPTSYGSGDISTVLGHGSTVPTIVFHGDRDNTVHPRNGDHVIAQKRTTKLQRNVHRGRVPGGYAYTRTIHTDARGRAILEHWEIHGAGHAWSGGSPAGSYTDPRGPDAAREMLRFFLEHPSPTHTSGHTGPQGISRSRATIA